MIFICGIVRASIPSPTFVNKMAKVTGMAIFMPVRNIPVVKLAMMSGNDKLIPIDSNGTILKLSNKASISI